jgi:hypothetical protein
MNLGTYACHVCPLRGTRYGMYAANWIYSTHMPVLNIRMWLRADVPALGLTDGDVGILREWIVISCLKA